MENLFVNVQAKWIVLFYSRLISINADFNPQLGPTYDDTNVSENKTQKYLYFFFEYINSIWKEDFNGMLGVAHTTWSAAGLAFDIHNYLATFHLNFNILRF
ncbi:hypothetical protein T4B_2608 [Trichinella pseudospiralis]|uniref:Uncharacterized protein n=1 Tax=Trichinella pseudospiralis TaxID=6337 RepID=A0A0V1IRN3_TRIPS|nr:hypothetical protein T4B_2608 [Trichinella pseudospiralis]